jgi:CBS domain-containing protein
MMQSIAPPNTSSNLAFSPSASLLGNLRQELQRHTPFSEMEAAHVDQFILACTQAYFAPGEVLCAPAQGVVSALYFIRQGAVSGERGMAELSGGAFLHETGDIFPVSAALAQRAVTATYKATADTFVLVLPVAAMRELAHASAPFGDFLNRRILKFLELSRRALQVAYSSTALAEQSLETPLGELLRKAPVACTPDTPLRTALGEMYAKRIGCMLVTNVDQQVLGILTRYDVLGRVTLGQTPLDAPISQVMASPVHCLDLSHSAQDAALLMSRFGLRHVPITRQGRLVGVVSERDLFAMQRLSLRQVGTAIRAAPDVATLQLATQDVRRFAVALLGQGVQAKQLTALISHLNDAATQRLIELLAHEHGVDLGRLCWMALGSEGRSEQTISTDQDNAIVLANDVGEAERAQVLRFADAVNTALDACGYPLCKGGVMARNPQCCLTLAQWQQRFMQWMEHGAPEDLLNASIYFDFRALSGNESLATTLRERVTLAARGLPRFHKQLALNALTRSPPLTWVGNLDTTVVQGRDTLDLKLQGAAIFVDAARVYALAQGVSATNTRERLQAVGQRLGLQANEHATWIGAFEFLQMLRLRVQLDAPAPGSLADPNRIDLATLNDIDRRILKESFRAARSLQQRLALDYQR